jgi:hypothetical protein
MRTGAVRTAGAVDFGVVKASACLRPSVVVACLAIADEAEQAEAERHHGPCRWFGNPVPAYASYEEALRRPFGFSPASNVISKPPVAVQLP